MKHFFSLAAVLFATVSQTALAGNIAQQSNKKQTDCKVSARSFIVTVNKDGLANREDLLTALDLMTSKNFVSTFESKLKLDNGDTQFQYSLSFSPSRDARGVEVLNPQDQKHKMDVIKALGETNGVSIECDTRVQMRTTVIIRGEGL